MTLTDLLAQYDVTEDDLTASLERRLWVRGQPGSADLTAAEVEFWDKHAGVQLDGAEVSALERATEETVTLIGSAATSLTIDQAADRLGGHRSRISHRLHDGQLYSFRLGAQRRLPAWQFTPDRCSLPGLEQVLAALPRDLHPTAVEGFFSTPNPDLDGRNPTDWLAGGGDPQHVVDEAISLDRW